MRRGFILQSTYRIEAGKPIVLIYGKLESGGSFLIRDTQQVPSFYVRRADADRARALGAPIREEDPARVTLRGEPAVRVEVRVPQDVPPLREKLAAENVECYEADVPFASRYLIDRGIRGSLEIRGNPRPGGGTGAVFENPLVLPSDWTPHLSILSLDIETDPRATRLLSIALAGCGASEVLLFSPPGYTSPSGSVGYPDEKELLQAFIRRVRELDPDILTGWMARLFAARAASYPKYSMSCFHAVIKLKRQETRWPATPSRS